MEQLPALKFSNRRQHALTDTPFKSFGVPNGENRVTRLGNGVRKCERFDTELNINSQNRKVITGIYAPNSRGDTSGT